MTNVINFSDYKKTSKNINNSSKEDLTINEIKKLENLRDGMEQLLNTATAVHGEPLVDRQGHAAHRGHGPRLQPAARRVRAGQRAVLLYPRRARQHLPRHRGRAGA